MLHLSTVTSESRTYAVRIDKLPLQYTHLPLHDHSSGTDDFQRHKVMIRGKLGARIFRVGEAYQCAQRKACWIPVSITA